MPEKLKIVLEDLQNHLRNANIQTGQLSTIARHGDDKLVEEFMTENVFVTSTGNQRDLTDARVLASHLYVACFWGFRDIVKRILEAASEQGTQEDLTVNQQNPRSLWTPLHAATFQEHGPIIMMLLEAGAKPELPDAEGRTAKDFASASDKVWGHFARLGLSKTNRGRLIGMGILKQTEADCRMQSGRVGSARSIRMAQYSGDTVGSLLGAGGDVLANDDALPQQQNSQPHLSVYK